MYVARVHIRNHPLEFRGRAARGVATAAVVAGALAILAPTAAAQQTIRGRLEASDQVYAGGRVQDSYPVRVRAGTRLTVRTVATPPLMTAVMMQSPANGLELMEPEGNPRGETFEWIYTKDITRDETVTVLVVGMAPVGQRGGAGDYTLRIEAPGGGATPAPAPAPAGRGGGTRVAAPAARVLRAGVRVQGELAATDPVLPDDDSHYDDYTYTARAGERITVRLNSTAFDAFLHVGAPGAGSTLQNPVSDDDGGGGTNSRVEYVAARSGPVTVRVNTLSGGETGAYTLMLESTAGQVPTPNGQKPGGQSPGPAAPAARALRAGQRVEGVLAASAPRLHDGSHYADYTYAARRGERIVVRLDSDAFDAFLHVGRPGAGNALENESSDDDAGGGTNSRVEYVADRDGPVTIRVNTLGGGETGRFSIVVEAVRR